MPRLKALLGRRELGSLIDDFNLNKAFQLAHSIYQYREEDRGVALTILRESLRGLEVRLVAQDEADRHAPHKPTKVRWGAAQWLQLLIYSYSERHEKQQEAHGRASLGEEDMIIRYIKHLILITCRRNSFHICLGLGRLLYDYSAAETVAIYDFIFQDPDSSTRKGDAYYRARKNVLVDELSSRFRQFVRIAQGPRGERRFQTHARPARLAELTARYLRLFTTWETYCALPQHFDAWSAVGALQEGQMSQIHALLHPDCFSRVAAGLKLDPPERRLALPTIFLSKDADASPDPGDGPAPSTLTPEEAAAIRNGLAEDKERRRVFSPRSLTVLADGVERARLDLTRSGSVSFEVGEETSLLELFGSDQSGELLLATHMLDWEADEGGRAVVYTTVLEGGQKLSLKARPVSNAAGGLTATNVEVTYSETNPGRVLAHWWRRLNSSSAGVVCSEPRAFKPAPSLVLAAVLALTVVVGLMLYFVLRNTHEDPQQVVRLEQPPAIQGTEQVKPSEGRQTPTPVGETPPPRASGPRPELHDRPPKTGGREVTTRPGSTTREQQAGRTAASLGEVKRVYVEPLGDDVFGRDMRQRLVEALRAEGVFEVAEDAEDADTAITWRPRRTPKRGANVNGRGAESASVVVEVVNVSGEVIWRGGAYRGTAEQIVSRLTRDFVGAVRGARRHD